MERLTSRIASIVRRARRSPRGSEPVRRSTLAVVREKIDASQGKHAVVTLGVHSCQVVESLVGNPMIERKERTARVDFPVAFGPTKATMAPPDTSPIGRRRRTRHQKRNARRRSREAKAAGYPTSASCEAASSGEGRCRPGVRPRHDRKQPASPRRSHLAPRRERTRSTSRAGRAHLPCPRAIRAALGTAPSSQLTISVSTKPVCLRAIRIRKTTSSISGCRH